MSDIDAKFPVATGDLDDSNPQFVGHRVDRMAREVVRLSDRIDSGINRVIDVTTKLSDDARDDRAQTAQIFGMLVRIEVAITEKLGAIKSELDEIKTDLNSLKSRVSRLERKAKS